MRILLIVTCLLLGTLVGLCQQIEKTSKEIQLEKIESSDWSKCDDGEKVSYVLGYLYGLGISEALLKYDEPKLKEKRLYTLEGWGMSYADFSLEVRVIQEENKKFTLMKSIIYAEAKFSVIAGKDQRAKTLRATADTYGDTVFRKEIYKIQTLIDDQEDIIFMKGVIDAITCKRDEVKTNNYGLSYQFRVGQYVDKMDEVYQKDNRYMYKTFESLLHEANLSMVLKNMIGK